jgi:DNA-directed RNA polymerase specialized sigma subunit
MINICTRPGFPGQGDEFVFDESVDYSAPRFRGQAPTTNNLTKHRWRGAILSPDEVADALKAAKGPEPGASAAKDKLFRFYHRLALKQAKPFCDGVNNDDIIAVANLALAEAINGFDLTSNNGLAAYVIATVRGRLQTAAKAIKKNGWAGETRLQRLVYGNHDVVADQRADRTPPSQVAISRAAEIMGRPVALRELEEARDDVLGMVSEIRSYDTREPGFQDDDEKPCNEEGKARAHVAAAPLCPLLQAYHNASKDRRPGSVEWYAEDADRRARKRLKEVGRRQFALELVARDQARISARSEPSQYLYRTDTPLKDRACIASRIYANIAVECFAEKSDIVNGRRLPDQREFLTSHVAPMARRYVERSFNSAYRKKKPKKPPPVFIKKRRRSQIEIPVKPEPSNPPFRMPRVFAIEVGGMPLLTNYQAAFALRRNAALNTGDYHNDNARR